MSTHLLIGWCVGYFQGEGQENILLCKGGGGGHYMKNKNKGGVCQLNLISKKAPMQKCAKNAKRKK